MLANYVIEITVEKKIDKNNNFNIILWLLIKWSFNFEFNLSTYFYIIVTCLTKTCLINIKIPFSKIKLSPLNHINLNVLWIVQSSLWIINSIFKTLSIGHSNIRFVYINSYDLVFYLLSLVKHVWYQYSVAELLHSSYKLQ